MNGNKSTDLRSWKNSFEYQIFVTLYHLNYLSNSHQILYSNNLLYALVMRHGRFFIECGKGEITGSLKIGGGGSLGPQIMTPPLRCIKKNGHAASLRLILMHIHANLITNWTGSLSSRAFAVKHEILRLGKCDNIPVTLQIIVCLNGVFKGTSPGLNGIFLPLVMKHLGPLKF